MSQEVQGNLSAEDWQWVTDHMPIACVDIVAVQVRHGNGAKRVGLIRRKFVDGTDERIVWCHIGGRVLLDENLAVAAHRHLDETLLDSAAATLSSKPVSVAEFFRRPYENSGHDPSKHAISAVFLAEFPAGHVLHPQGEALEFQWFDLVDLPVTEEFWPGSRALVLNALEGGRWQHTDLTYQATHSSFVAHNQLMWQTPVLAMTAMAFLLTIALGDGEGWARALAGSLSALTAFVSVQLMAKHSYFQIRDAELLHQIEIANGMLPINAKKAFERTTGNGNWADFENWLGKFRSRSIWILAMLLFGFASVAISVFALFGMA